MKVTETDGFSVVRLTGASAIFSDARGCPSPLAADALAQLASQQVAELLGHPVALLFARQEHTRIVFSYGAEVGLAPGPHLVGTCDALITAEPDVALSVRTADCLPVVLAGGGAVAVVHAGWRGLAADILGRVVARFGIEYGVPARRLEAVIGVGIGPCHYEVGDEVREGLAGLDAGHAGWRVGRSVDLSAFARGRLAALGVDASRVLALPGCTFCSGAHHSFRREGTAAGRQWAAATLV